MKSIIRLSVVLCLLLVVAIPLFAQEPAELDPADINIPEEWDVTTAAEFDDYYAQIPDLDAIIANQGDFWVMVMTPAQIDALTGGETPEDPAEAMIAVYDAIYDYKIDPEAIAIERISGFTVTGWHYADDEPSEGQLHIVSATDGGYYLIDAYGTPESMEEGIEDIDNVLIGLAAYARETADIEPEATDDLFVPEGWDSIPVDEYNDYFADVQDLDGTVLFSDDVTVLVLTPEQVEAMLDTDDMPEDADTVMFDVYNGIYDFEIASDTIVDRKIGGMDVRAYNYTYGEDEDPGEGETYVFPTEDGGWYFVDVYGLDGEIEKVTTDVDAILESVAELADAR